MWQYNNVDRIIHSFNKTKTVEVSKTITKKIVDLVLWKQNMPILTDVWKLVDRYYTAVWDSNETTGPGSWGNSRISPASIEQEVAKTSAAAKIVQSTNNSDLKSPNRQIYPNLVYLVAPS